MSCSEGNITGAPVAPLALQNVVGSPVIELGYGCVYSYPDLVDATIASICRFTGLKETEVALSSTSSSSLLLLVPPDRAANVRRVLDEGLKVAWVEDVVTRARARDLEKYHKAKTRLEK